MTQFWGELFLQYVQNSSIRHFLLALFSSYHIQLLLTWKLNGARHLSCDSNHVKGLEKTEGVTLCFIHGSSLTHIYNAQICIYGPCTEVQFHLKEETVHRGMREVMYQSSSTFSQWSPTTLGRASAHCMQQTSHSLTTALTPIIPTPRYNQGWVNMVFVYILID